MRALLRKLRVALGIGLTMAVVWALTIAVFALASCTRETREDAVVTPLIELRIAHQIAAPELQPMDYEGQTFYLETRSVIADDELQFVEPTVRGDTLVLELHLTPEGAVQLRKATGENIGKHLAFLLDGSVRNIPIVRSAIGGAARVTTTVDLPRGEAVRISERIRLRWPQPK